ncbi:NTP transferase domain-containing protein [bacterium]|nr:NTP transferase domain-containing protein [bacterium]
MVNFSTNEAVIIAAGQGSRIIKDFLHTTHKCLIDLDGKKLIEHIIFSLASFGIRKVNLVTGFESEILQKQVSKLNLNIELKFIKNDNWEAGNGTSVFAASGFVRSENFILTMADHWFSPDLIKIINDKNLGFKNILAVDELIENINDVDDATKVKLGSKSEILEIGKDLEVFDAIDCGVFRFSHEIFEALEQAINQNEFSLSGGVKRLIKKQKMHFVEINGSLWQDVDTVSDLQVALEKYQSTK